MSSRSLACAGCNETAVPLRRCSRCHSARYCSVACQRLDWARHRRAECGGGPELLDMTTFRDLAGIAVIFDAVFRGDARGSARTMLWMLQIEYHHLDTMTPLVRPAEPLPHPDQLRLLRCLSNNYVDLTRPGSLQVAAVRVPRHNGGDEFVAASIFTIEEECVFVHFVGVAPAHQRRGWGKRLVEFIGGRAGPAAETLGLWCDDDEQDARAFWVRLGAKPLPIREGTSVLYSIALSGGEARP